MDKVTKHSRQANSEQRLAIKEKPNRQSPVANRYEGFSLIEFMVVITIIAILTTIVTVNFRSQRAQQETRGAADDLISKMREVQNFILAGREVRGLGETANVYVINFSSGGGANRTYRIDYRTDSVATTTLETITLPAHVSVGQLLVGGVPGTPVAVQLYSPFGKITVEDSANLVLEVRLDHESGYTRTVVIDGISGRIGPK